MRIGIDGRGLQGVRGHLTGIGRYTAALCQELDRLLPDARFFVYGNAPVALPVESPRWTLRVEPWRALRRLRSILWLESRCGSLCRADALDAFWGANFLLPRLPRGVRGVVTIYDLAYRLCPETMPLPFRVALRAFVERDIRRADAVLTISRGTADRLADLVGVVPQAIVPPALDAGFGPRPVAEVAAVLARHGIAAPFLLGVATWEPRKNLDLLVRVFCDAKRAGSLPGYTLALVGARGWKDGRLARLVRDAHPLGVRALGYVPREDLPALYAGAEAFVFPSRYEGFGLPVLEARACGTRVVTTDLPELREAGGEACSYAPPTADGLRSALLAALAAERPTPPSPAALPSWTTSARLLAAALRGELAREAPAAAQRPSASS